jgi:hypothetical protein
MLREQSDAPLAQRFAWGGILTVVTVASTLAVSCGTPFAALATLAALFLPRRDAFVLITVNWLANQAIGFGLLHYPLNWVSYRTGISLGVAALLSTLAAMLAQQALRNAAAAMRTLGSFGVAFITYEAAFFLVSPAGTSADFGASVVLYILCVNAIALAALLLLQTSATVLGLISSRGSIRYSSAVPRGDAGDRP